MNYIKVNNLEKFQHYKDRHMVWFKWYIDCLQDYKFMEMTSEDKWVFIGIVCLACKNDNQTPYDKKWLIRTLNVNNIEKSINNLTNIGLLASCYQNDIPIREDKIREDKIREDTIAGNIEPIDNHLEDPEPNTPIITFDFDNFWLLYPKRNGKRVGRGSTLKIFNKRIKNEQDYAELLKSTKNYAESDSVKRGFALDPVRFFKDDFWKDWVEKPEETTTKSNISEILQPESDLSKYD